MEFYFFAWRLDKCAKKSSHSENCTLYTRFGNTCVYLRCHAVQTRPDTRIILPCPSELASLQS